jgi:hypothetical protein
MIDREARNQAVMLLRRLVAGRVTNDEFEDAQPASRVDPAIDEVFYLGVWGLYSDLSEHRLVGRHRLPREARREVARFILFLKSGLDYGWPRRKLWEELLWLAAGLLTLGLAGRFYWSRLRRRGDVEVWPFLRREDFERAFRHPCYFAGSVYRS